MTTDTTNARFLDRKAPKSSNPYYARGEKAMNEPNIDLKALREKRGWSQEYTAQQLGFSRNYISSLENGKNGISKAMMRAIIEVFGVTYDDFYDDDTKAYLPRNFEDDTKIYSPRKK